MAHNTSIVQLIAVVCIYVAHFQSSTGFICRLPTNQYVQYDDDQICCNGTLQSTNETEGRIRHCCGNILMYPDKCACDDNSQMKPLNPDFSLESCLVAVSDQSYPDPTKSSPSSSKMPENTGDNRCRNTDQMYCKYAETCFDPSEELCCPDGVFRGKSVCPSHDFNSKFCSNNDNFKSKKCPNKYKHAYSVTIEETITKEGSSTIFLARARNIMSGRSCKRRRHLSEKKVLKLKINMTNCDLTGKTLTVFSTKKHRWNSASYIYLDKDDLVLSRQFRHKCLNNIDKTCIKSILNQHLEVKRVSNSGDAQYIPVLSSVTLRFIFCLVVHTILNTLH